MKIVFSGAHRTGKTSLAERIALDFDFVMYYTEVAKTFKTRTVKQAETLSGEEGFYERILIQENILAHVLKSINNGEEFSAYDRSPLDVYAYSELFLPKIVKKFKATSQHYMDFDDHCKKISNQFNVIDFTFIVQPGIVFEDDPESCSLDLQENMNDIIINAAAHYIPADKYRVIPREIVDFEQRVDFCTKVLQDRIALHF